MSFQKLQEALEAQADAKVAEVQAAATRDLKAAERRIKSKASGLEEAILDEAQSQGQRQAAQLHQNQQLKTKALILKAKQEELAKVSRDLTDKVLAWDKADRKKLLEKLARDLKGEKGSVTAGEADLDLVRELAQENGWAVATETMAKDGGFKFRGENTESDFTVSNLVAQVAERSRAQVAQQLF